MLRTFLAIDLDERFLQAADALAVGLRAEVLPRARWVARSNMHVTLRFLGATDESLVPSLGALVARIGSIARGPIEPLSTSLVAFPHPKRARVLGLHIDDGGVLMDLASAAEREVVELGFAPEERTFRPHVTLARFRQPADLRRLFVARSTPPPTGRLTSLTLYRSELGGEAPVYSALARFDLALGCAGPPV